MNNANIIVKPIQRRVLAVNEERHVSPTPKQKQSLLDNEHVSGAIKQAIIHVSEDYSSVADSDCDGV